MGLGSVKGVYPLTPTLSPAGERETLVTVAIATAWLFTGQSLVWPSGIGFVIASTALCVGVIFSPFTRACSLGLASLIALQLLLAPTWFAHNRLFVAALLVMGSLSWALARWQVALVFAVAAFDKLLEPAWRDGRFLESFIAQLARFGLMWAPGGEAGAPNALAAWLEHAGNRPLWMAAGLGVIALELLIASCFLASLRLGAWLNAAFHLTIFAVTGSTMGQFFFAGLACSLLLIDEDELPSRWVIVGATVALAGPWTHRFLPLACVLALMLWRWRRSAHVLRGSQR